MYRQAVSAMLLIGMLASARAGADGCFMVPEMVPEEFDPGRLASSPRQEALLITDGRRVRVALRTHFEAGPEELAWVVPVPGRPTNIAPCSDGLFDDLERATAPRIIRMRAKGKGGSPGCTCGTLGAPAAAVDPVRVLETGTAGVFEYAVLEVDRVAVLADWLAEHDYRLPEAAGDVLERYAGWHFLAMRVRPEQADRPTLAPHPIAYSYADSRLLYPLVISRLSSAEECEIVLYVLSSHRYACANWGNALIDAVQLSTSDEPPGATNYEAVFRSAVGAPPMRSFVTEYCGPAPIRPSRAGPDDAEEWADDLPVLTRLRTVVPPEGMDRDVLLVPTSDWDPVSNVHHIQAAGESSDVVSALAIPTRQATAMLWLLVGVLLRRRCGWRRHAGSCLVALSIFALVLL